MKELSEDGIVLLKSVPTDAPTQILQTINQALIILIKGLNINIKLQVGTK